MVLDVTTEDIKRIMEEQSFEGIIYDAMLTPEDVLRILDETGYINLERYLDDE